MSATVAGEREFLNSLEYPQIDSPWEQAVRRAAVNAVHGFLPPRAAVLELGCADGYMTSLLAPLASRHIVVDAVPAFIAEAKKIAPPGVEFVDSLFEEYEPAEPFDLVVMSFVLEHVLDPVALMSRARAWLKPHTGRVLMTVPNRRSMSRLLARSMGLVRELEDLTENDLSHGHRRCYDRASFDRDVEAAGLEAVARGGLVVKPFANFQLDRMIRDGILGRPQLDGLEKLGAEYPDACAALYTVAR
jgi:2-polyprenyl-3-methyl-5-hydroxy-6-metoxy-1,4-benzoquinol methylase